MKVLITGGAGFLGLHLARYYQREKHQVTLLDIAPFPSDQRHVGQKLVKLDVRDAIGLTQIMAGHEVVVHAAAALPLWNREDIFTTNLEGTKNVLAAAKKQGVRRVVHISSTAVYGVPKKHPIFETDQRIGVGPYGESKILAEEACFAAIQNGQAVTIVRPKTFIGTERLGVFEILFDWIHDGKKIPIIGNGENRYQLLDVDDLVEAIYLFSRQSKPSSNDAFNIGAKQFSSVRTDLQALFDHAKSGSRLFSTPAGPIKLTLRILEKLNLSPLYQWIYDTADKDSFVSIDKLEKELHWSPRFSNAQAFIKSYDWYQQHYSEVKLRGSGVTHTAGWKQGALGLVKKLM